MLLSNRGVYRNGNYVVTLSAMTIARLDAIGLTKRMHVRTQAVPMLPRSIFKGQTFSRADYFVDRS